MYCLLLKGSLTDVEYFYWRLSSCDHYNQLQLFRFGFTPFWAKRKMYFFNARSEGDYNKENDPNYTGSLGIVNKPAFRLSIRKKRCRIIADAFIEGPKKEKLSKP